VSEPACEIDVVLPAHNEGGSIGRTLTEFYDVVAKKDGMKIRFVVCEDGSTDDTVPVLKKIGETLPLHLISDPVRKGYSRAVIDGLRAATAPLVAFIDSDGQCDPEDFKTLYALIGEHDLVMGYRNPRSDHWIRLLMSGAFKMVYQGLFRIPVRDPSCPYLIIRRESLAKVLSGDVGILKQGFWWEFVARAASANLRIVETPVRHRPRTSGTTQVYRPTKVPRIAAEHLAGLVKLKRELSH
jgi:glycosyltransferase involved in cell wall biosynthesis